MEAPFDSADFRLATFGGRVDFDVVKFVSAARFNGAVFKGLVDLSNNVFGGSADFRFTTFGAVTFMHSVFNSDANFTNGTFNDLTSFNGALFGGELNFSAAVFVADVYFGDVTFKDYVKFTGLVERPMFGATSSLDLQFAKIEEPSRVSFHTLILRPHWFINVSARDFDFLNVTWRFILDDEIDRLKKRKISATHVRLSKTFRDIAINSEENHRYEQASRLRYWAMDTLRLEAWRGFVPWRLSW